MRDLIDRQAAIDAAIKADMENHNGILSEKRARVLDEHISYLPSAEPEKVLIARINLSEEQVREAAERAKNEIVQVLPSAQPEITRIEQELHGKTPEEQYEFLYWLLLKYGLAYTDSRLAVIEWLKGERE